MSARHNVEPSPDEYACASCPTDRPSGVFVAERTVTDMTTQSSNRSVLALLLSIILPLAGCGGSDARTSDGAGAATAGTFRGAVQGLDDGLAVNGVTFHTAGALLRTDDAPAGVRLVGEDDVKAHLTPGMVVTVHGWRDDSGHGEATEIEFHHQVEGTVDDRGAGHVVVAGAVVSIDDSTEIVDRQTTSRSGGASRSRATATPAAASGRRRSASATARPSSSGSSARTWSR